MTRDFEILAAIDLRGGSVVRLQQGDFRRETNFSTDPVAVARMFVEAGARWLHVVDLDGARSGAPVHADIIGDIVRAVGNLICVEVSGGLRDEASVAAILAAGAARAVVGTTAIREPAFAGRLVIAHGPAAIAVAVDVRGGFAVGQGWTAGDAGVDATLAIERLADGGVGTFEVTAIERDGLLEGPDLALYRRLVGLGRGAVVASGGIGTLDDIRAVRDIGCSGVIVGRALYEGRFPLGAAIAVSRGHA